MDDILSNAVTQLPSLAIFVWFILKFWDRIQKMMDARDVSFLQALEDERSHRIEMMDKERQSRADLAERLAEQLKSIAALINRLEAKVEVKLDTINSKMLEHDARAEQYIYAATDKIKDNG